MKKLLTILLMLGCQIAFAQLFAPGTITNTANPSNGNVGIGTASPSGKLHIFGSNSSTTNLVLSANYESIYRWRLKTTDRGNAIDLDFTASDASDTEEAVLQLSRSTSDRPEFAVMQNWLVTNNGNVGIGTTRPASQLSIFKGSFGTNTDGLDGSLLYLNSGNTPDGSIIIKNHGTPANQVIGAIKFHSSPDNVNYSQAAIKALAGSYTTANALAFYTSTTNTQQSGNEVMRIQGGNVGIGTTTPVHKIVISDNGAAGIEIDPTGNQFSEGVGMQTYNRATYVYTPLQIYSSKLVLGGGNVLIGQTTQVNSAYKLDVAGSVRANEIVVNTTGADFVFEKDYKLRSLQEVESFIKANKHLPEIAEASQMKKEGVGVGELQTQLLKKIEELTLYMIELKKENENQQKKIAEQQVDIELLKGEIGK